MKPLIILAALAAAALVLRRNRPPVPDADDSEVVGMPTGGRVYSMTYSVGPGEMVVPLNIDWDEWFRAAGRKN